MENLPNWITYLLLNPATLELLSVFIMQIGLLMYKNKQTKTLYCTDL